MLREALAEYLVRARGVACDPARIVVCAGFAQGLELLCAVLRDRGAAAVALEAYGHRLHRAIVEHCGPRGRAAWRSTREGAVVGELGDAAAALLTPAHQFPLGVALAPARRRQAVAWAAETGALLIEDDYDGEFRYDRQAVGAMQSLAPGQVVYAGTAARASLPACGSAGSCCPASLVDEVVEAKARPQPRSPSTLEQLTLAELISGGGFDRQVRRARLAYRRRRDRLSGRARDAPGRGERDRGRAPRRSPTYPTVARSRR